MQLALDTSMNGVYGVFLAIWASVFVESWKHKQKRLIFEWDLNSVKEILNNDERKGKYRFMYEYNSETNTKMKESIGYSTCIQVSN